MEITCKTNDTLPLSALTEFQGGLKKRTEDDYNKIIKSINKYGFAFPFFVWQHDGINHVLDGHGRLGALQRMTAAGESIPDLPVVYVNAKDEVSAKDLLLRLNSSYGKMTVETVRDFIGDISIDFEDLELPKCSLDLSDLFEKEITVDDDKAPNSDERNVQSERGAIYELGNHRLMCGDSTDSDDMEKLMGGQKADLIVTDPPYNVDYTGKTKDALKIENDKKDDVAFLAFLTDAFHVMFAVLKQGGAYYICHAGLEGGNFMAAVKASGIVVRQCLIWVKNSMVMGRQDYQWQHEPILYGWNSGAAHFWGGRRDLTTVIHCDKPSRNESHPTMKPVKLFETFIENSSKAEDIILDPFGGSGTTIIASEKLGRCARVMELDPVYCDVIRRRYTQWAKENNRPITSGCLE